jgi:hypothetical protein
MRGTSPQMHIATIAIGADFKRALAPALNAKREYAARHGYTYVEGGEDVWDRHRPIAWSKVGFVLRLLERLPDGEFVWLSDADVLITNPTLRLEDHVLPLLPADKDLLLTLDACAHVNSGNMLMRVSPWLRDFWRRVDALSDFTYHIWWENAAIIHLLETNVEDALHIHVTPEHKRFNAYLQGLPGQPLWLPGDFLVHFAGVYDPERMAGLITAIRGGKIPRLFIDNPKKIEFLTI